MKKYKHKTKTRTEIEITTNTTPKIETTPKSKTEPNAKIKIKAKAKNDDDDCSRKHILLPENHSTTAVAHLTDPGLEKQNELQTTGRFENMSEADIEKINQMCEIEIGMFSVFEKDEIIPKEFFTPVYSSSLESQVGYSSLVRQLEAAFNRKVAFYRSTEGGRLSPEEAVKKAFRTSDNEEQAKKVLDELVNTQYEHIDFLKLAELATYAPRTAERFWERLKSEGRKEFESGHLATYKVLPTDHMRKAWNVARYLGVRESFIDEWKPKGGIEISLIDMLVQAFYQYQYWVEQSVLRTQTTPREEHEEYKDWKERKQNQKAHSWEEGYWFPPYVKEQRAVEHAAQMVDRWNRIYMRTLRQLRDLRRYSPVTINNPNQVNIASEGGQQINVSEKINSNEEEMKQITS